MVFEKKSGIDSKDVIALKSISIAPEYDVVKWILKRASVRSLKSFSYVQYTYTMYEFLGNVIASSLTSNAFR